MDALHGSQGVKGERRKDAPSPNLETCPKSVRFGQTHKKPHAKGKGGRRGESCKDAGLKVGLPQPSQLIFTFLVGLILVGLTSSSSRETR
jgi:hypothetical protein